MGPISITQVLKECFRDLQIPVGEITRTRNDKEWSLHIERRLVPQKGYDSLELRLVGSSPMQPTNVAVFAHDADSGNLIDGCLLKVSGGKSFEVWANIYHIPPNVGVSLQVRTVPPNDSE